MGPCSYGLPPGEGFCDVEGALVCLANGLLRVSPCEEGCESLSPIGDSPVGCTTGASCDSGATAVRSLGCADANTRAICAYGDVVHETCPVGSVCVEGSSFAACEVPSGGRCAFGDANPLKGLRCLDPDERCVVAPFDGMGTCTAPDPLLAEACDALPSSGGPWCAGAVAATCDRRVVSALDCAALAAVCQDGSCLIEDGELCDPDEPLAPCAGGNACLSRATEAGPGPARCVERPQLSFDDGDSLPPPDDGRPRAPTNPCAPLDALIDAVGADDLVAGSVCDHLDDVVPDPSDAELPDNPLAGNSNEEEGASGGGGCSSTGGSTSAGAAVALFALRRRRRGAGATR